MADELRSERWIAAQDVRGFSHRARFMQMGCDLESVRNRPVIGVLNTWNGISPGHAELRRNAERVRYLLTVSMVGLGVEPASIVLPANGLGRSRATSLWWRILLSKIRNSEAIEERFHPPRIPPQSPPAGVKKAEAGQFHSPRKIVCPADLSAVAFAEAESNLCSGFSKKVFELRPKRTPPSFTFCKNWRRGWDSNPR